MAFSLERLLPKDDWRAFAWLGRHNWLKLTPHPTERGIAVDYDLPKNDGRLPTAAYRKLMTTLGFFKGASIHTEAVWMWTLGRLMHTGVKMFRPTVRQCEAMCEVEINMPLSEYAQPYPVIVYEYPEDFCKEMAAKLGCNRFPSFTVCSHDHEQNFVQVASMFAQGDTVTTLIPYREGQTVEEVLTSVDPRLPPGDPEFKLGELLQRIALNFSLMMTHHKVVDEPQSRENTRRWRELQKSKDPDKREKGRLLGLQDIRVIRFEQNIKFYDEETERKARPQGEPTGRMMPPHWRKGHWLMQAHGPGRTLRKRQLRKPVFIHPELFLGDITDTKVVYEGRDRKPAGPTTEAKKSPEPPQPPEEPQEPKAPPEPPEYD